jgi:hypothetical protein
LLIEKLLTITLCCSELFSHPIMKVPPRIETIPGGATVKGSDRTVTTAAPDMAEPAAVALTVKVVAVSSAPTVSKPEELMFVFEEVLPSTLQLTVWGGLLLPFTTALNSWVAPFSTVADAGDTVTLLITGPEAVTVTVAVPDLVESAVEVALTVKVAAVSFPPTVSKPDALMLVPLPPPLTFQLTLWEGLLLPLTTALNSWLPPFSTAI